MYAIIIILANLIRRNNKNLIKVGFFNGEKGLICNERNVKSKDLNGPSSC